MAFNAKTDWKLQDTVEPADMNRIEQGIVDVEANSLGKTETAQVAKKLETARTFGLTGDATGEAQSFDGSGNVVIPVGNIKATTLKTPRKIGLSSGAIGTATSFDGSADIVIPVTSINPDYLSKVVPVSKGGTGGSTFTAGQVLVGNGTDKFGQRAIDTTAGGTQNSDSLITSGAVFSGLAQKLGTNDNAASASKLQVARNIGGVAFDGTSNINLPGVNTQGSQDTTGNAATATKLQTARTIGGVSFDGTANISLPGVNTQGTQNTTGNAGSATKLQTARTLSVNLESTSNVTFDGTANATVGVNGVLPVTRGGTGQTSTADLNRVLTGLGRAPAEDLPRSYPEGIVLYVETPDSVLPYKPSEYGLIISMKSIAEVSQFWFTQPYGTIYQRGGNTAGWNASSAVPAARGWVPVGSGVGTNAFAQAEII